MGPKLIDATSTHLADQCWAFVFPDATRQFAEFFFCFNHHTRLMCAIMHS
jgi:hypothetical protein